MAMLGVKRSKCDSERMTRTSRIERGKNALPEINEKENSLMRKDD